MRAPIAGSRSGSRSGARNARNAASEKNCPGAPDPSTELGCSVAMNAGVSAIRGTDCARRVGAPVVAQTRSSAAVTRNLSIYPRFTQHREYKATAPNRALAETWICMHAYAKAQTQESARDLSPGERPGERAFIRVAGVPAPLNALLVIELGFTSGSRLCAVEEVHRILGCSQRTSGQDNRQ